MHRHRMAPVLAATVIAAALVVSGCAPAGSDGPDSSPSPSPAAAVDGLIAVADDRSIYAKCEGEGSPTVVLIAGKGNGAQDWQDVLAPGDPAHDSPGDDVPFGIGKLEPSDDAVFPSVARFTRVCTYDRPDIRIDGPAVTTPRQQPHTVDLDVDDLHALLTALGETGPVVLVAHSYGGLIAALYARLHPESVAGLVMVDTVTPLIAEVARPEQLANWNASNSATSAQGREGVQLLDAFEQFAAAPPMPQVPAVVLSADKPWRTDLLPPEIASIDTVTFDDWLRALDLLAQSLDAENITRTGSGHDIYLYNPALVVDAIEQVVDEVRGR